MLIRIIAKYFFYNRKKTYVAVLILAMTLSILISSSIILSGYKTEITRFTGDRLNFQSGIDLSLHSKNNDPFTQSEFTQIYSHLNNNVEVDKLYLHFIQLIQIPHLNGSDILEVRISDIGSLVDNNRIDVNQFASNFSILMNDQKVEDLTNLRLIELSIFDNIASIQINQTENFQNNGDITTDIIIDSNSTSLPEIARNQWNNIEIDLFNNVDIDQFVKDLERFDFCEIELKNYNSQFIENSINEIINVLTILQIVLSILLTLSISYIMLSVVQDSFDDIKIMNTIGLDKKNIFMIFLFQTLLITIAGYILAFFFSIFISQLLLTILNLVFSLPYLTISINFIFQIGIFIYSMFIGLLGGLYPSIYAVNNL